MIRPPPGGSNSGGGRMCHPHGTAYLNSRSAGFPVKFPGVSETFPGNSLAATTLSERDLLIHAVQHLEDISAQLAEVRETCAELAAELAVFRPLLRTMAPEGKLTIGGVLKARREVQRVWPGIQ